MVDLTTIVDAKRLDLAHEAAAKLCHIAEPLQRLTAGTADPEIETAHQLAIRMADLTGVILSALSDDAADLRELARMLYGPEMARQSRREAANG